MGRPLGAESTVRIPCLEWLAREVRLPPNLSEGRGMACLLSISTTIMQHEISRPQVRPFPMAMQHSTLRYPLQRMAQQIRHPLYHLRRPKELARRRTEPTTTHQQLYHHRRKSSSFASGIATHSISPSHFSLTGPLVLAVYSTKVSWAPVSFIKGRLNQAGLLKMRKEST